jgi:hypothetical protein
MTSEAQTRDGRFVEVGWSFHGVLLGSRAFGALRWMTSETSLGEVALQSGFICQLSLSTWGQRGRASLPSAPAYGS